MERHPTAGEHLPAFIAAPGQTDILSVVVVLFLLCMMLVIGNLYFRLHALPERMAHRTNRVQLEIVAVLALISLVTHNHLYWIAALLLAFIRFPDFSTPMSSIARSLERLADRDDRGLRAPEPVSGSEPLPALPPTPLHRVESKV